MTAHGVRGLRPGDAGQTQVVAGIDFGGTKVAVGIGAADGQLDAHEVLRTRDWDNPTALVDAAVASVRRLLGDRPVGAIGISTMGITQEERVLLAPNVPAWEGLSLPERIRRAFPDTPVAIENDVKAALMAELQWGVLKPWPDAAYLNLGTGIELAWAYGGQMQRGAHGASGEIAYLWRPGEPGFRDGHAPLEERVAGGALDREVERRFPGQHAVADLFSDGHPIPEAQGFLEDTVREIAAAVGHALLVLDVDAVAVGGGFGRQLPWFRPILEEEWTRYLPFPPTIVASRFPSLAGLMGALAVGSTLLNRGRQDA